MQLKEVILRKTIPVIINSFNQEFYLRNIIDKFQSFGFENIYVLDNQSTSPKLINYYGKLSQNSNVTVIFYGANLGPRYFHLNGLTDVIGDLPHLYTDPDLDFELIAENYVSYLLELSRKYKICKVGSALEIPNDDLIKSNLILNINGKKYSIKEWESQFWINQIEKNIYFAPIDTTIHLFNPQYYNKGDSYITGLRVAKVGFIAKHLPWYHSINVEENLDMSIYKKTQDGWNNY